MGYSIIIPKCMIIYKYNLSLSFALLKTKSAINNYPVSFTNPSNYFTLVMTDLYF